MLRTRRLLLPRRFYAEIDYAMHMPKAYTDRMEMKIPKKVYDNRFGAPPVTLWKIHPDDNQELLTKTMEDGAELMQTKRPWEVDKVQQTLSRERENKRALFSTKFLQKAHREVPVIPAEEWTFFQGDLVVVMVGRDKGKAGFISHVIREENAVFVEGLNTKPIQKMSKEMVKTMGYKSFDQWEEQPLFVHRGQVRLVDPNDDEPCTAKWILNDSKTSYIRVSIRTGYEIPLPKTAHRTYEYAAPAAYIEVPSKDTPANTVLKQTYVPKLCTFEQEIEEQLGLEKHQTQQEKPPTYWY